MMCFSYSLNIPFMMVSSAGVTFASSSAHFNFAFTKSLPKKISLPVMSL